MSDGKGLNEAAERLTTAVKAIEQAVARRRHDDLTVETLEEQLRSLQASLEAERRRGDKLSSASNDVTKRIDALVKSIEDILKDE